MCIFLDCRVCSNDFKLNTCVIKTALSNKNIQNIKYSLFAQFARSEDLNKTGRKTLCQVLGSQQLLGIGFTGFTGFKLPDIRKPAE